MYKLLKRRSIIKKALNLASKSEVIPSVKSTIIYLMQSYDYSLIHINSTSKSLLYFPCLATCLYIPKQTSTHAYTSTSSYSKSLPSTLYKSQTGNLFLCVKVVFLFLPIYIFLYINSLKARLFLFHFTQLYIYYTLYTFILMDIASIIIIIQVLITVISRLGFFGLALYQ